MFFLSIFLDFVQNRCFFSSAACHDTFLLRMQKDKKRKSLKKKTLGKEKILE